MFFHTILMPHKRLFLGALLSLTLLFVACSSPTESANETVNNTANADLQAWFSDRDTDLTGIVADGENVPADSIDLPANTAVDGQIIPMGFTAEGRPYKGNLDATVVIEEFSDYQCPYCARWATQTLPSLSQDQLASGEAVLIYYDFPLSSHPQAPLASNAARCAGEQDITYYWQMHDMLFARTSEWSHNNANVTFVQFGQEIDLPDMASFQSCVENNQYEAEIEADYQLGLSRNVGSTPTFFLNNQILIGAQPLDVFNQAITALANGQTLANQQQQPTANNIAMPTPVAVPVEAEMVAFAAGDPNAPVQIVEYTDYQCPFCQYHALTTLPQILSEMIDNGRVHYVLKDLPLDQLHPNARIASKAARCAGEQEAYLEMHDALFAQQETWQNQNNLNIKATFNQMAADLSLNTIIFDACLNSSEHDAAIQANVAEAFSYGINSTPTFFVNGYMLRGAQEFDVFTQVVEWAENGELEDQVRASIEAAMAAQQGQQGQQQPQGPTERVDIPTDNAYSVGDANAPITIIEYTDFQCPFCARHFQQTYPQLKEQYIDTGIVRYVFKDFPLRSIHPQAQISAEAARCAGEQEAYVEMHHILFAKQGEWSGQANINDLFVGYASELGLDADVFRSCLDTGKYQTAVDADFNEARELGLMGTPSFFINGYFFSGTLPLDTFTQVIEQLQAQP